MTWRARAGLLLRAAGVLLFAAACSPGPQEKTGTQTNWLTLCESDSECGELSCTCGVCSSPCDLDAQCSELPGAECIAASDPGAVAICGGQTPSAGMCLPRCGADECASGSCVAGVCDAVRTADVSVSIDITRRHQALVGFGASLGYGEDAMAAHPQSEALFDAMFATSGFDMVRMRNRFEGGNADDLSAASTILAAAAARLGHAPTLLLTEGSPPAALKANGDRVCAGNPDTCTLARGDDGAFVYSAFADHWRASLDAHVAAGLTPDYLSIQNNPDWSPPDTDPLDACRLLPEEGEEEISLDGTLTTVEYPGYREALAAVTAAFAGAEQVPQFVAPEVGSIDGVNTFVSRLDATAFSAVGFHLYYTVDSDAVEVAPFHALRDLAQTLQLPAFQTEMRAEALQTAILTHYSVVESDAVVYLQNDFVAVETEDPTALIALGAEDFTLQSTYYALRHFAHDTEPGWTRVDAVASETGVLASAWLSPADDALTVVLVNPASTALSVELALPAGLRRALASSAVTRTVFAGVERSAELGTLGKGHLVTLPAESIVTVAFTE